MKAFVIPHVEVGQRIRERRLKHNLTQRHIQAPGVSYAYISRIENGTRRPSLEALIVLARALGTTGLQLLTGSRYSHCPLCERTSEMLDILNWDGDHPVESVPFVPSQSLPAIAHQESS